MTAAVLPARARRSELWLIVVLGGLAVAYTVYVGQILTTRGLFEYLGGDYRTFRSSAEIARTLGFARVYDLDTQAEFQRALHETYSFGLWRIPFVPTPTPYLPAFIVPFLVLPYFAPIPGFVFWTLLNIALLIVCLRRLLVASGGQWRVTLSFELTLCLPVFFTLIFGQINMWLLVFLSEFLIANRRGDEVRSGLWLGGLLLKPQTLILFLPGLLVARRFKILAGWMISALVILGISVALAGLEGLVDLAQLVRLYPANLPTTFPESMMNWRALTINQAFVLSPSVAWRLAMAGIIVTLMLGLSLWLRPMPPASPRFAAAVLGTWAATAGVAWHAHVHMAVPMLAPLLYVATTRRLPVWLLHLWVLVPSLVFLEEAFRVGPGHAHMAVGLAMLAVNSCVLGWATKVLWSPGDFDQPMVATSSGLMR
jgi:hypothetical protein